MQLRNRRTGDTWRVAASGMTLFPKQREVVQYKKMLQSKFHLGEDEAKNKEDQLLNDFMEDVINRLPRNLPKERREKFIKNIKETCKKHGVEILKHARSVLDMIEKEKREAKKQSAGFSINLSKLVSLTLAAMSPAAAAATIANGTANYILHPDIPPGGIDMCADYSSIMYSCLQGFLTDGENPWTAALPQFNRIVEKLAGNAAATDVLADKCDFDTIGEILKKSFTGAGAEVCNVRSDPIWYDAWVRSYATNMSISDCSNYRDRFVNDTLKCMDEGALTDAFYWRMGIALGVVGLVAVCLVGCWINKDRARKQEREPEQPGPMVDTSNVPYARMDGP